MLILAMMGVSWDINKSGVKCITEERESDLEKITSNKHTNISGITGKKLSYFRCNLSDTYSRAT